VTPLRALSPPNWLSRGWLGKGSLGKDWLGGS
jgi:hypothetical protein